MRSQFKQILFKIYRLLPEILKCWISRLAFKPKFGKRVNIFGKVQFEDSVEIGDYSYIHGPAHLGSIHIGKFCSIAKNLSCITSDHDLNQFSTYTFADVLTEIPELKGKPDVLKFKPILPLKERRITEIGNDVWIGENVTIMRGIRIGNGAVLGTNNLVLNDIPPFAVAVGIPAKVIKYRLPKEKIEFLENTQWWDWPIDKIADNFELLNNFGLKEQTSCKKENLG